MARGQILQLKIDRIVIRQKYIVANVWESNKIESENCCVDANFHPLKQ